MSTPWGRNDGAMMLTSDDTKLFETFYPLNGRTWRCLAGNGGGIGLLTNCAEIKSIEKRPWICSCFS